MNKKNISLFLLILSLLFSFALFYFRDFFSGAEKLGLLGIFIINFISSATFFVSGPAFLTVIAGGSIYPPLLVAFIASLGASFGDMVSYVFGFSGRSFALSGLNKKLWFRITEDIFKKYENLIIFLFAIIPNPFFDAVGLLAGIMGMKYYKFFAIMLAGRFARFVILAFIGAKL